MSRSWSRLRPSTSHLGQNAQRLGLGPMRLGSRLALGLEGLVPIPAGSLKDNWTFCGQTVCRDVLDQASDNTILCSGTTAANFLTADYNAAAVCLLKCSHLACQLL